MKQGSFAVGAVLGGIGAAFLSLMVFSIYHIRDNEYGEHVAFAMSGIPVMSHISLSYLRTCPQDTVGLIDGDSVMGRLMVFYSDDDKVLANTLIGCGQPIELADIHGLRPLHSAILSENEAGVRFMISRGADLAAPIAGDGEHKGQTPLRFAKALRAQATDKSRLDQIIRHLEELGARD
jgi:hypothetical protein